MRPQIWYSVLPSDGGNGDISSSSAPPPDPPSNYDTAWILTMGQDDLPPELLTSYHDNDYYKEHPILDRRQTLQEDSINPHNGIVIEQFMGALL